MILVLIKSILCLFDKDWKQLKEREELAVKAKRFNDSNDIINCLVEFELTHCAELAQFVKKNEVIIV